MRRVFRSHLFKFFLGLVAAVGTSSAQQVSPIYATIDARKVQEPISKYDYGMFVEHIGNLINHSIWSELLDDRKFYFPITSTDPKDATQQSGTPAQRARMQYKKWRPIGLDDFVVMEHDGAYVGEQSPRIKLEASTPHGIQQSGLALIKGKSYVGRIVLSGTPGAKIKVNLIWGANANDSQAIAISTAHSSFATFPLKFTSQANTTEGRFEIVGTGSGSFRVGAVSLMPTDNLHGFRPDTIGLLKQLHSGFWRLPGGNFISDHDWRDAIGDPDKRPPTWDYAWNAMQPNDVGMDELMTFCKLIGVEPYITVNAGLGDNHSAADLVEYANGSIQTRMGALRAKNGHPEPYHIKFWNVGNEPYGWWQVGFTPIRYWVIKHNLFVKAMRKVDPTITILASGATPDEMTVNGIARLTTGKVAAEFGTESDWTGNVLEKCWGNFDGITEHWYERNGIRFDIESLSKNDPYKGGIRMPPRYGYVPLENETLVDWAHRPSNRVRTKVEAWEEYKKRFPAIMDKKIFMSMDEWAYTGTPTNLKLGLSYALVMQEIFRHTDFLKMSAFTMGVSTIDYNSTDSVFNTTGLMFKLYRDHFGTLPVEVTGNSPQPDPKWPAGAEQPKVNAGSPTYPLDVVAAFSADKKFLTIAVVNPTESAQQLELNLQGVQVAGQPKMWQMTGPNVEAANVAGQKAQVEIVEKQLQETIQKTMSVDPISVNIYSFPVR